MRESHFNEHAPGCRDGLGALILTDQWGFVRPFPTGGRCDIGAYEFGWSLFLPLIAKL